MEKSIEKNKKLEGYTFVETLAVLAIGAILTAGTTVSASKLIEKARETSARTQIDQFYSALQSYFLDCGCFPTTEQGLSALWELPVLYPVPELWNGPYVEKAPGKDPWGTEYEYVNAKSSPLPPEVPSGLPFILRSFGADKERGGHGNGKDIVSWQ